MNDELPIILLSEVLWTPSGGPFTGDEAGAVQNRGMKVMDLHLDVFGEPVRARIGVRDVPARLADIVPMARTLSSKLVQVVMRNLRRSGTAVPCGKGCAACYHHLIGISIPEAFRLVEEVAAMPPERREGVIRCSGG